MLRLLKTDASHPDFPKLVAKLDAYLAVKDGDEHAFYDQYNGIAHLKYVVMAFKDDQPVGCGAFNPYDKTSVEIKRMYTSEAVRGQGIATQILALLEQWAKDLGYETCILETGKRQTEAVALYKKTNYIITDNYPPYEGIDNSVCFKKDL